MAGKPIHGESHGTPEYSSWKHMVRRCYVKSDAQYARYGGRGITVCDRWHDYAAFLVDMGRKPTAKHTIERDDVDANYEPSNCRWATRAEQNANKSDTIFVELLGERVCLAEAARRVGLRVPTVHGRVRRGWSIEQALALSPSKQKRRYRPEPVAHVGVVR